MKTFQPIAILFALAAVVLVADGCTTGAECGPDSCCVTNNPPIGRRKRQLRMEGGHCEPMGGLGDGCYMNVDYSNLESGMLYGCPCEPSFVCIANGDYEVPIGETGNCGKE